MIAHWWVFAPLAVLLAAVAIAGLIGARKRLARLLDEARDDDRSRS